MSNETLTEAKRAKKDEFYTQFGDIQNEISAYLEYNPKLFKNKTVILPCDDPEKSNFTKFFSQNFQRFGLKKLISTSYAPNSKLNKYGFQGDLFDSKQSKGKEKSDTKGKIFQLSKDINADGKINIDDIEWDFLKGDGDFNDSEIIEMIKSSDFVITNPPFSLLREFVELLKTLEKKFIIVSSMNGVGTKDIFQSIKENKIWLGNGFKGGNAFFAIPNELKREFATGVYDESTGLVKFRNVCWLTNLEHGRRHEPLKLMTMEDNLRFNKKLKDKYAYEKYQNYGAIEVPLTESIPSDYKGAMGVPISFLDKYCPEQFEILGMCENLDLYNLKTKKYSSKECKDAYYKKFNKKGTYDLNASGVLLKNGILEKTYQRVLIRHKN